MKNKFKAKPYGVFDIFIIVSFTLLALLTLYPFYNVLIVSFSNTVAVARNSPYLVPHAFDLTGYKTIFQDKGFFNSLKTSLFVTIVGTFINMLLSVTGAYVLSKKHLAGRKLLLSIVLFTMLFSGGLIPTYLNIKNLNLVNSPWVMVLPTAISTYYMIIMKNYFMSLPASLTEAAKIDGANELTVLCRIILPISLPFIATFILFYTVERWNEWYNAMLYINEKKYEPLQIYLRNILINMSRQLTDQAQQMMGRSQKVSTQSIQMATIVVATVPILCVYPAVQKHFVKGIMIGGVKE